MMLLKTIDGLFIATRYVVWVLGLLGIIGSVILAFANFSLGFYSVLAFIAAFFLSIAVALLLMPGALAKKYLISEGFQSKRLVISVIAMIIAVALIGFVYFINGGFPDMNLLFI